MQANSATKPIKFSWQLFAALGLTLVRIYSGFRWFSELGWKWPWHGAGGFGCPDPRRFNLPPGVQQGGLCDWMQREADHPFLGLYGDFVKNVVIPNFDFFAWFTIFTESFIAFSLIAGFLVRLGGITGFLFCLNLIVGVAAIPGEDLLYFIPYLFPPLIVAVLGPRWQFGLDTLLMPTYRKLAKASGKLSRVLTFLLAIPPESASQPNAG